MELNFNLKELKIFIFVRLLCSKNYIHANKKFNCILEKLCCFQMFQVILKNNLETTRDLNKIEFFF